MADDRQTVEVGTVVQLQSGGPPMTIEYVVPDGTHVDVAWFSADGLLQREQQLHLDMLRLQHEGFGR